MRPSIITIVLLMFLSACSPQSNQHYEKEESLISGFLIDAEVEFCILIPVEGCTTCTNHGLKFAENNIENNKIRFILTDVSSQKNTKIKVGENYLRIHVFQLIMRTSLLRQRWSHTIPLFSI